MSYNEDELQSPEWIDSNFLKTALEHNGDFKNIIIKNYKITPGSNRNDHFASIMFRARVDFAMKDSSTDRTISLIIKAFPVEDGFKKDMLSEMNWFEAEVFMYDKVIDGCEKLLSKCGYAGRIAPNVFYTLLKPQKVIVLEDLKESEYFVLNKNVPDENELNIIFSKLAQFHATTFKLIADGRDDLKLKGTMFNFSKLQQNDFYQNSLKLFAGTLDALEEFKDYVKKFQEMNFNSLSRKCAEIVTHTASYNVLNHGDFHFRNMMFKNNQENVTSEVILLDFQIPHFGSPAYDLIYASTPLSCEQRDAAIRHYFKVFCEVLVKIDYTGVLPTYEQLIDDFKGFALVDLYLLASLAPFVLVNWSELPDDFVKNILQNPEFSKSFYLSSNYTSHVKERLPKLLNILGNNII